MTSRAFSNQILRSAAALATLGLTTFLYANQIELRAFKLHRVQVPVLAPGTLARVGKREGEPFRILHVSDFHMLPDQKLKQKWVGSLDALNPHLVINTGDNLGSDKA
ncbi:MAG: metallophosphoesterase, partial [Corynebacterium sp.]|nr:metallophosphoesterase [Corynebacterium sp.]